jgi:hypothetical protein
MSDLRYPIGSFQMPAHFDAESRKTSIAHLEAAPSKLKLAVAHLTETQLDTPYRPEGWTVRQVVHHLADAHMNGYVRFKLALTEEHPTIRTYEEKEWSEQKDAREAPIDFSLSLLISLHGRWVHMLRELPATAWSRTLNNPDMGDLTVDGLLAIYAWHGQHHVAHITTLRERSGW